MSRSKKAAAPEAPAAAIDDVELTAPDDQGADQEQVAELAGGYLVTFDREKNGDDKYVRFYHGKGILDHGALRYHRPDWYALKGEDYVQVRGVTLEQYADYFRRNGASVEPIGAEQAAALRAKWEKDEDAKLRAEGFEELANQKAQQREKAREKAKEEREADRRAAQHVSEAVKATERANAREAKTATDPLGGEHAAHEASAQVLDGAEPKPTAPLPHEQ